MPLTKAKLQAKKSSLRVPSCPSWLMNLKCRELLVCLVLGTLPIPAALAADENVPNKDRPNNDQQAFCKYQLEQATAQRDLLLFPDAIGGITQPNTGLPTQAVWGFSGSLSNIRKSALTMDVARKNCELYTAATSTQQEIQYALPNLERQALQHRLDLIDEAMRSLDALAAATQKMLEAQNMTRPMAFLITTTRIKLDADRADTQSRISAIYTPPLNGRPLKDLVAEKQGREVNEQKAIDKLTRQNDWDVALSVGAHQQISPIADSPAPYGEFTISYNLASHAINKHLDRSADAYAEWKKVQEGDVMRNAEILKQQVVSGISVQDSRLNSLQQQFNQLESSQQLIASAETTPALDFRNQLATAQLLLRVEIGDASFRLDHLKEFLTKNF